MAEEKSKPSSSQSKKKAPIKEKTSEPVQKVEKTAAVQKPVEKKAKSNTLQVGATVTTPSGKICKILTIEEDLCRLQRIDNQKKLILSKTKLTLKK